MQEVGKGIGIACLVVAIIAIFIPIYGGYLIGIALIGAAFAALFGDKTFTISIVVISFLNVWFLSPVLKAAIGDVDGLLGVAIILFAAPIIALFLNATGKVVLGKPPAETS